MPTEPLKYFSIRRKLFFSFLIIIGIILAFGIYLFISLNTVGKSLATLDNTFDTLHRFSALESNTNLLRSATRTFTFVQDPRWEQIYDETSLEISKTTEELKENITDPESMRYLEEYEEITGHLQGTELLIVAKAQRGETEQAQELFDKKYEEQHTRASLLLGEIVEIEREKVASTIDSNTILISSVQVIFTILVFALILSTIVISLILTNNISRSLRPLLSAAKAITRGDFNQKVDIQSSDEIGRLAASFNIMTSNLQKMMKDIQNKSRESRAQNIELERTKTNLENAVAELKELDAVKSEFVSLAAHQLRTPLTGIKWTLHSLSEENIGKVNKTQKKIIDESLESTAYLIELVNDLLNVARLEEGMLGFDLAIQHLLPIIKDAFAHSEKRALEKGVSFSLEIPEPPLPPLNLDKEKIMIVLDNLLTNAIKYTPAGGKIILRVEKEDNSVKISVEDTGIGIPRKQFHRIFTKFFRSEKAQRSQAIGTGLGLYIAQRIISQHGGKITFTSIEGKGSTFSFSIPIPGR